MFLARCDKDRYGPMLAKLANDQISGQNAYPDTRLAVYALLNNWNTTYKQRQYTNGTQNGILFTQDGGNSRTNGEIACWGCGMKGVCLSECKNTACIAKFRARLKKKKQQGMIEQGKQHYNAAEEQEKETTENFEMLEDFDINQYSGHSKDTQFLQHDMMNDNYKDEQEYIGYDIGNQFNQSGMENKIGDSLILLDSQNTHSTFYVRQLVTNIRDAPCSLKMFTN